MSASTLESFLFCLPKVMETAELHRKALSQTCRVCGSYVKNKKSLSSKEKYEELILSVYGIDFKLDDEDVHPPRICASCRYEHDHLTRVLSCHEAHIKDDLFTLSMILKRKTLYCFKATILCEVDLSFKLSFQCCSTPVGRS